MRSIYDVVDRRTAEVRQRIQVPAILWSWVYVGNYGRGCGGHDYLPHDLMRDGDTLRCMRCPWTEPHAPLGAE